MRCFLGAAALLALILLPSALSLSRADTLYQQTNLVSDVQGLAQVTDPNLVNPWGVSFSATGPWWVSDAGNNVSTVCTACMATTPATVATGEGASRAWLTAVAHALHE